MQGRVWSMSQFPPFGTPQFSFFNVGATQSATIPLLFATGSAEARLLTRALRWHLEVDATQTLVTVQSYAPDRPNAVGQYVWSVGAGKLADTTVRWGFAFVGATRESVGWPYIYLLDESVWPDWAAKDNQLLDLMASAGAARRWVRPPPRSAPDATRLDFPGDRPPPLPFDERSAPFFHAHDDLYVRPGDYQSFVDGLDNRYRRRAISPAEVTDFENNYFDPRYLRGDFSIANGAVDWTTPDARYADIDFANVTNWATPDARYADIDFANVTNWATPDARYAVASIDVYRTAPPIALLTLPSMPRLAARLVAMNIAVNAANIGRVTISVTAAEVVTATGAPVKAYAAYAGPTQFAGATFRWAIVVWDPVAGAPVAAAGPGNQLSLTVTACVT